MQKTAALRAAVFPLFPKNLRGGASKRPPGPARVKRRTNLAEVHFTVRIVISGLLRDKNVNAIVLLDKQFVFSQMYMDRSSTVDAIYPYPYMSEQYPFF